MLPRKSFFTILEKVPLSYYGFAFIIVILGFAELYYFLTPYNNGIAYLSQKSGNVSFLNALYFSVVTISSLGYGDMQPIGWSKFLAGVEVLFGLAMMGIILAKLTSGRLSYHVRRLFGSDAQKRFDVISAGFESLQSHFPKMTREIGQAFQTTPGSTEAPPQTYVTVTFDQKMEELHKQSRSIRDYLKYELEHGDFFADAPLEAIKRAGESIDQVLFLLGQLILSLTSDARMILLSLENKRRIAESLECHKEVCNFVIGNSRDNDLKRTFTAVQGSCSRIPKSYFSIPEVPEQPDQVLESSDEPQDEAWL